MLLCKDAGTVGQSGGGMRSSTSRRSHVGGRNDVHLRVCRPQRVAGDDKQVGGVAVSEHAGGGLERACGGRLGGGAAQQLRRAHLGGVAKDEQPVEQLVMPHVRDGAAVGPGGEAHACGEKRDVLLDRSATANLQVRVGEGLHRRCTF
eukprot:1161887-Pleurochrysis_carterae.AAC.6